MHGMQRDAAGFEPVRDFTDMLLAVGVVDVLARAEDLNGLGPAAYQLIEQAGMQPLLDENVSGNCSLHISLSGRSPQIPENIRTVEASVVRARESNHEFRDSRVRFILLILD